MADVAGLGSYQWILSSKVVVVFCCMRKIKVISDKIVRPPRQSETNDLTHKSGTLSKATRKQYLLSLLSSQ